MRWVCIALLVGAGCGGSPEIDSLGQAYTQQCATQSVEGLDVYRGNGTIDWAKVAASGRKFAFIKATQGNYNTQSTFGADWTGAAANGIIRSPYHFFDPTVDGVTQAQYFLNVLDGQGGLKPDDLPPMLDIECPTSSDQAQTDPNCEGTGASGWVQPATLSKGVFDWLSTVEQATGRKAILYSYPSWFGDNGFTDARLADYPLFIATYASCASVPAPFTQAVFWQYSSTATVPGITGSVDVDRFFGTDGDLTSFVAGTLPDGGADLGPLPDGGLDGGAADGAIVDGAAAGDGGIGPGMVKGGCACQVGEGSLGSAPLFALLACLVLLRAWRKRLAGERKATAPAAPDGGVATLRRAMPLAPPSSASRPAPSPTTRSR